VFSIHLASVSTISYAELNGGVFILRESTFIMPRGGGDEDVKGGAPKYFLALKGGL
jgi:hypothetical protein